MRSVLYAPGSLPPVAGVGIVPHKAEIAPLAALAERLRPDKIHKRQVPIIDDVRVAAHRPQLHQVALPEDLRVDAFVALKVKFIPRVVPVPGVAPAKARALFEAEGDELLLSGRKKLRRASFCMPEGSRNFHISPETIPYASASV